MFCPECGNQLPDNVTVCERCGYGLKNADVATLSTVPTQKGIGGVVAQASSKVKIGVSIAAAFVVVLIIAVGAYGCSGASSSSTGTSGTSTVVSSAPSGTSASSAAAPETPKETQASSDIYANLTGHYWVDKSKDANIKFFDDGTYVLRIDYGTYGKYQGTWEKTDGGITLVQTMAMKKTASGKVSTDKSTHRYSVVISGVGKDRLLRCFDLGLTLKW